MRSRALELERDVAEQRRSRRCPCPARMRSQRPCRRSRLARRDWRHTSALSRHTGRRHAGSVVRIDPAYRRGILTSLARPAAGGARCTPARRRVARSALALGLLEERDRAPSGGRRGFTVCTGASTRSGMWRSRSDGRDLAAVLACGSGALLSHRSAARPLAGRPARAAYTRSRSRAGGSTGRASSRGERARSPRKTAPCIDGIPVTSRRARSSTSPTFCHEQRLADAVHEAEVQRILDVDDDRGGARPRPGRRGRHRLARVLAAYGAGPPHDPQRRRARLPPPVRGPRHPRPASRTSWSAASRSTSTGRMPASSSSSTAARRTTPERAFREDQAARPRAGGDAESRSCGSPGGISSTAAAGVAQSTLRRVLLARC